MFWAGLAVVLAAYYGLALLAQGRSWPPAIRSLLSMKAHYLLFGLGLGMLLPKEWADALGPAVGTLIVFVATWSGFVLGTTLDFRTLRGLSPKLLGPVLLRTCCVFLLVYAAFRIVFPVLQGGGRVPFVGSAVAVVFAGIACIGMPWAAIPALRTIKPVGSLAKLLKGMSPVSGAVALVVASAAIYASRPHPSVPGGLLRSPSWLNELALSCVVGGIAGMVADVLSRDERDVPRTALLLFATLAVAGGLAQGFHLLAPLVGMVGGAWLINATLRRMDIIAFTEQSAGCLSGVLLVLVGVAVGAGGGATAGLALTAMLGAVVLFVTRMVGDIVGCNAGARAVGLGIDSPRWLFGLGLLPQGGLTLAMAFVVKDVLPDWWFTVVLVNVLMSQWISPYLLFWSLASTERARKERPTPLPRP